MSTIKKSPVLPLLKKALIITFGCFVFAASVNIFFVPADLNTGGLTGIALIFNSLWNVPIGLVVFLLNIPLLLLAIKYIGFKFIFWTIYATVISSLLLDITAPLEGLLSLDSADKLLFCIFGGAVSGAGLGIVFTQGASTGGTDIISRLTALVFPHITLGRLMLICDIVIITFGALVSGEMEITLYSAVAIYLSSGAIDTVLYGLEKSQAAIIVSSHGEEINRRLLTELERGVTRIPSKGGYSANANETLICAVSTRQMSALKEIVSAVDPNAFVIFTEVHDIMGDGFRMRY
ncbi:MAG: YitT family protein [Clostridia bacterium]|nr:YitT family protein [Clostridia bacterium]